MRCARVTPTAMPTSRCCAWTTKRRGSAASPAATAPRSAASRCRMTGAAWSSSPRSTTCSRALRRRQCRTSTWPSVSRKPKAFHWNDRLAPSPAQAGEGPKQQLAAEAAPTGYRKENNIMSDLLWQTPGVAVAARTQAFLAGDDVVLDREFFLHDIAASRVRAERLPRIGILSTDALAGIVSVLEALAGDLRDKGRVQGRDRVETSV